MCQPKFCLHCGGPPFSQISPSAVHLYLCIPCVCWSSNPGHVPCTSRGRRYINSYHGSQCLGADQYSSRCDWLLHYAVKGKAREKKNHRPSPCPPGFPNPAKRKQELRLGPGPSGAAGMEIALPGGCPMKQSPATPLQTFCGQRRRGKKHGTPPCEPWRTWAPKNKNILTCMSNSEWVSEKNKFRNTKHNKPKFTFQTHHVSVNEKRSLNWFIQIVSVIADTWIAEPHM